MINPSGYETHVAFSNLKWVEEELASIYPKKKKKPRMLGLMSIHKNNN